MGGSWSETVHHLPANNARLVPQSNEPAGRSSTPSSSKRKRSCPESSDEDVEELSPNRKRIKNTSKYIYETLFLNGANHDITINALGKKWKLHKVYLCQSGYFSSKFSGNWADSGETNINLDVPNPVITTEALDVAFGSLYKDQVHLTQDILVPVIAAAAMLQLDGLLEHGTEFMKDNLVLDCVPQYLTVAEQYGLTNLKQDCLDILNFSLLRSYNLKLLKEIDVDLFATLLGSPDLYVMQVEMDVYTLSKRWLYTALHPDWTGDMDELLTAADKFFRDHSSSHDGRCFLECEEGEKYVKVFREIRIQHILNDLASIRTVEADTIVPNSWLLTLYRNQWLKMLAVDQRLDPGPGSLSIDSFKACSQRCGRVITQPGEYCWRWTGFSFGFDVLLMYHSNTGEVKIKRNTRSMHCVSVVSLQPTRMVMIRMRASSLDSNGKPIPSQESGVYQVNLGTDEEYHLMSISNPSFPLCISVNLALLSEDSEQSNPSTT